MVMSLLKKSYHECRWASCCVTSSSQSVSGVARSRSLSSSERRLTRTFHCSSRRRPSVPSRSAATASAQSLNRSEACIVSPSEIARSALAARRVVHRGEVPFAQAQPAGVNDHDRSQNQLRDAPKDTFPAVVEPHPQQQESFSCAG